MPRYYFTVRNGDRFDDEEGIVLPDDVTAQKQAIRIIQELKADEADWRGYTMEVTRDGQVVWEIPFELASADPHSG